MYMYMYIQSMSAIVAILSLLKHSVLPRNWPRHRGRVEFLSTSKDLRPHPFPHQSKFILKALIFKVLKYAGENTVYA